MGTDDVDLLDLTPVEAVAAKEFIRTRREIAAREAAAEARRRIARESAEAVAHAVGSGVLNVFGATQNTDLTEGRGGRRTVALFLLPEDAVDAQRLIEGVMGGENSGPTNESKVYLSVEDWLADGGDRSCNRKRLAAYARRTLPAD